MKQRSFLKMSALMVMTLIIYSCKKEDIKVKNEGNQNGENKIITSDERKDITTTGCNSTDEMLKNGWVKLDVIVTKPARTASTTDQANATVTEKLTFANLNGLGFNEYKLKDLISAVYKTTPDGISINSEGKFSARNPTITDIYSQFASIQTGTPTVTVTTQSDEQKVVYDYTLYNYSDVTDNHTLTRTHQTGTTSNWSVTSSVNVSIGAKVGIPISEASVNVSVGLSATNGGSESNIVTDQLQSSVSVPPHTSRRVVLIESLKNAKYDYEIPVFTSGYLGSNFGKRVNGHYYWFDDINDLIGPDGRKKQLGKIIYQNVFGGDMYAYTPQPL